MRRTDVYSKLKEKFSFEKSLAILTIAEKEGIYDDELLTVIAIPTNIHHNFDYEIELKDIKRPFASEIYEENYNGYLIKRVGNGLQLYDPNCNYIKRIDTLAISYAKIIIDNLIKDSTR